MSTHHNGGKYYNRSVTRADARRAMLEALEGRQFFSAAVATVAPPHVHAAPAVQEHHHQLTQAQLNDAAARAYEYGYPLVYQYLSEKISTDVPRVQGNLAPVNQLASIPLAPLGSGYGPNADTIYTFGWLDLTRQPVVIHAPNTNGRFYSIELSDAWTNAFSVIGKRTTGTQAGDYAIVGPDWHGHLPAGVHRISAPTNLVQVLARTLVYGPDDVPSAEAIRQQYSLTPLDKFGTNYTPPTNVPVDPTVNTTTPVRQQIAALSGEQFFEVLARALKGNPPLPGDREAIGWLKAIGLKPGKDFPRGQLTTAQTTAIAGAPAAGQARITADDQKFLAEGTVVNGWKEIPFDVSSYGTNYADRAAGTSLGFNETNLPQDAIYPSTTTDSTGQQLSGANDYTITFSKGELPPAADFWSLTLYQYDGTIAGLKFYPNSLNRYEIGDRTPFKLNADGSLTIYIQHDSPGADKESNWLPAPSGDFALYLRLYSPTASALDGTWQPPGVVRA